MGSLQPPHPPSSTAPIISVVVLVYNHERFVEDALVSVLAQQGIGPIQVLVMNDASTDDTSAILRRLEGAHPTLEVIEQPRNLGVVPNLADGLRRARGQYVALLEGDDYWTTRHKLAAQVAWLEGHPEHPAVGHLTQSCDEKGILVGEIPAVDQRRSASLRDAAIRPPFHTSSLVFRRELLAALPDWMLDLPMGDWPISAVLARYGEIAYLPTPMSLYRVHPAGVWSGADRMHKCEKLLATVGVIERNVGGRRPYYRRSRVIHLWLLMDTQVRSGARLSALRTAIRLGVRSPITALRYLSRAERDRRRIEIQGWHRLARSAQTQADPPPSIAVRPN